MKNNAITRMMIAVAMIATVAPPIEQSNNKILSEDEISWKPNGKTHGKVNGKRKRNANRWR